MDGWNMWVEPSNRTIIMGNGGPHCLQGSRWPSSPVPRPPACCLALVPMTHRMLLDPNSSLAPKNAWETGMSWTPYSDGDARKKLMNLWIFRFMILYLPGIIQAQLKLEDLEIWGKVFVWESFGRCTCQLQCWMLNDLSRNEMLRDPIFHVHDRQDELVMTSSACPSRCVQICLGSLKMEPLLVPLYTTCE